MGELNYPQSSHRWAWEKGIVRKCSIHNIYYDPYIGYPERLKEKREEERRKRRTNFDNVIWPDK